MQFSNIIQVLIGLAATSTLASPIEASSEGPSTLEARDTVKFNQYRSVDDWSALLSLSLPAYVCV